MKTDRGPVPFLRRERDEVNEPGACGKCDDDELVLLLLDDMISKISERNHLLLRIASVTSVPFLANRFAFHTSEQLDDSVGNGLSETSSMLNGEWRVTDRYEGDSKSHPDGRQLSAISRVCRNLVS
jgi:hypothetical protein